MELDPSVFRFPFHDFQVSVNGGRFPAGIAKYGVGDRFDLPGDRHS
jgi:hypothetical protein